MRNFKLEKKLTGNAPWPELPSVFVKGIADERDVSADNTEEENEKIIQSWKNVAVMRASAGKPTKFFIGFANYAAVSYLEYELETDMEFATRIGPTDNRFFVMPRSHGEGLKLELVEITTEDDEKYENLILV